MIPPNLPSADPNTSNRAPMQSPLRKAAEALEASFLAEMLKSAGLSKTSGPFGGGQGEDQFRSFLVAEQARQMVLAGGIGLAESFYNALKESGQ